MDDEVRMNFGTKKLKNVQIGILKYRESFL